MADTIVPTITINNNTIPQPTEINWEFPKMRGQDGNGMPRYEPYGSMQLVWNRLTQENYYTLYNVWRGHHNSGTAVVSLPHAIGTSYTFITYSGTYLDMPQSNNYYDTNYVADVRLVIRKVIVT